LLTRIAPSHATKGTHVAGTIAALGNALGVRGVIKDDRLCLVIARVFDDNSGFTDSASILEAVRWSVSRGAKVINLSLGGGEFSNTAQNLFRSIFLRNRRIVVAAAGNGGDNTMSYPGTLL